MNSPPTATTQRSERIRITLDAERFLAALVEDVLMGEVGLDQLPRPLADLYTIAYHQGRASLQPALDQALHDRDRYYGEMCRRVPRREPERPSFVELSLLRGDAARAERARLYIAKLFGNAA